jgi:hypothetical protein
MTSENTMTYNDMHERVKHAYILKLINECAEHNSPVLNKYVIPYLKEKETHIAATIGRYAIIKEAK